MSYRHPIDKLLIANRGEIAVRIARTCRTLGIATVAVYSDADADALHVEVADEAVRLGGAASAESYLAVDAIVAAAKRAGADAVHPGFGFLAENAGFAEACIEAGLRFVGPSPAAIRAMGDKRQAKERARAAGVPVIPGYDGADQSAATLRAAAEEIGFPVLLKASAGGGGKGMRVVHAAGELEAALEAAKREAASAFGDDTMLLERYIGRPRHVEIQILGDAHGNVIHLNERECSLQRRHQKIIEETPSPALDADLRAAMGEAAVRLAHAIQYEGAGTVEFLVDSGGEFYFLEVNTRLQVEHPITEAVTGIDLVAAQIAVAEGGILPFAQEDVPLIGAAIECRIYAEDPATGFLPASGVLRDWHLGAELEARHGVRLDSGVRRGDEVSIHYDPMLAKLVVHADSRLEALRCARNALRQLTVLGIANNVDFLHALLRHQAVVAGDLDTGLVERELSRLAAPPPRRVLEEAAVAATVAHWAERRGEDRPLPNLVTGFRNNRAGDQEARWQIGEETVVVGYRDLGGGRLRVRCGEGDPGEARVVRWDAPGLELVRDGWRRGYRVAWEGATTWVRTPEAHVTLHLEPRFPDRLDAAAAGGCVAPMPGRVVRVAVAVGAAVAAGQTLVVIEAMKMEQSLTASRDGVVAAVHVAAGDQVDADALLVELADPPAEAEG
jgi:acetyl-CoA carboxylase biotin carboxylase subunit